ncbi:hypothetical protein [Flavobacterium gossypii]|nr:hypothetical protein [Flavobacterium gossypii]
MVKICHVNQVRLCMWKKLYGESIISYSLRLAETTSFGVFIKLTVV